MYTAADIRNVEFTKTMGGYKVSEVEAFVEACAETVEAMTAEREDLNKKLSILADKLVEYRRDEDSIRSALLSAQRMGDTVMRDANDKADEIVNKAHVQAQNILTDAKASIKEYETELERVKKEVADFKAMILSLYKEHLAVLKQVPDSNTVVEPAQAETIVAPVEEAVSEQQTTQTVSQPAVAEEAAKKPKFANLKFGEGYNLDDDDE